MATGCSDETGGLRGTGVTLYFKWWIECEELHLKTSPEQSESLWVRIKERGHKEKLMVGVNYKPLIKGNLLTHSIFSCWGTQPPQNLQGKRHS